MALFTESSQAAREKLGTALDKMGQNTIKYLLRSILRFGAGFYIGKSLQEGEGEHVGEQVPEDDGAEAVEEAA